MKPLSIGVAGSSVAEDGREHRNGNGQSVPCPSDMAYYLSEDGHMWIPLWTLKIDQREAERMLPDWQGAYPKGGGA